MIIKITDTVKKKKFNLYLQKNTFQRLNVSFLGLEKNKRKKLMNKIKP